MTQRSEAAFTHARLIVSSRAPLYVPGMKQALLVSLRRWILIAVFFPTDYCTTPRM
jgi:hypothetical protein